jgi:hypothetical protein
MFGILQRRTSGEVSPALIKDLRTIVIEGGELVDYYASPESAIGRRAMRFVDSRDSDEKIDDAGFTLDELDGLRELSRLGTSSPFTEAVRRLVVHKKYGELDAALRALNWALDQAVAEQMVSGAQGRPTLNVVFRRLRESLQRAGKELVILVEDLKLLHGVERALLEILIDPADAIGLEPACRVRALVACTREPWRDILDDNETLASRLRSWEQPTYILTVPEEQSRDETLRQLDDLAAAYLNAARVGVEPLEREYDSVEESDRDTWLPAVACEECPHRAKCHEAFGSVRRADGAVIGLYPFNASALARAQDLVQRRAGASIERQLNPRVLLTQVLQPVLRTGFSTIPAATFPSPELVERLGISRSPDVARRLEGVGYPRDDIGRASSALLLWGARAEDGQQGLDGAIATAFDLEAPPSVGSEDIVEDIVEPEPDDSKPTARDPRQQVLSEWLNGGPFLQRVANETRQVVLRLVLEFVDWADHAGVSARSEALQRELGVRNAEHSIRIEGAAVSEGEPPAGTTSISFARDEGSYRFFLAALRWLRRTSEGELNGSDLVDLAEGLERAAAIVGEEAGRRGFVRSEPIHANEPALKALVVTSVVLGLRGSEAADSVDLVGALLAPTPSVGDGGSGPIETLQRLAVQGVRRVGGDSFFGDREPVNRDAARDWLLRRVAMRQSPQATDGEVVHAIDAARLVPILAEIAAAAELSVDDVVTENDLGGAVSFARLASQVSKQVEGALKKEVDRVRVWKKGVTGHVQIPADPNTGQEWFEGFRAALSSTVTSLKFLRDAGLVPDGDLYSELLDDVKALAPLFKDEADATRELLDRLVRISRWGGATRSRELTTLVAARYPELATLTRSTGSFVQLADRFLIQATNFVTARLGEEDPVLARFDDEFVAALDRAAQQLEAT